MLSNYNWFPGHENTDATYVQKATISTLAYIDIPYTKLRNVC